MDESVSVRREGVTGALAIVSVGTVLATAGGYVSATWLPRAPTSIIAAIPHVNVLLSLSAIAVILYGWNAIRNGQIGTHRRAMLSAMGIFVVFLILYLYRLIILGGPTEFDGDSSIYRFVYLPVLTLHIGLAIVCIPLLYDTLSLGITIPPNKLSRTRHPRVGRIAAILWLLSFGLGITVYALLYWM